MKKYVVYIDPRYSDRIKVNANSAKEAREKAFQKFKETKINPRNYKIYSRLADEFD